jgi:hypothetical protein
MVSDSSPASISFDDDDEEADATTAADESMPLYFDETQPESSANVSVSNNSSHSSSTRIHVNPRDDTDVITSRSSCDFNANVPSCPAQEPPTGPQSVESPERQSVRFYEEDPDEERLEQDDEEEEEEEEEEEDLPGATSSKVIHGCSFRLLYHGLSEIDELQPDSSAASGCWKYRTKKSMVEEAVLKLKVGHRSKSKLNKKIMKRKRKMKEFRMRF